MYDTPAAIDKQAGILYINPKIWHKLTPFQRKFVKLHEMGHYVLQTDIEEEADAYAFDHLVGTEHRSMKQCIETLETILDPNRTGHRVRINALIERAMAWDRAHPIKVNKASGSSEPKGITEEALVEIIKNTTQTTTEVANTIESKEQNSDNNRTMVYMMLAIAALFLLKD